MPLATGFLSNRDVQQIRSLAHTGLSTREIANLIGCSTDSVLAHSGSLVAMRDRAQRYARIVNRAAAYVPTFGHRPA